MTKVPILSVVALWETSIIFIVLIKRYVLKDLSLSYVLTFKVIITWRFAYVIGSKLKSEPTHFILYVIFYIILYVVCFSRPF